MTDTTATATATIAAPPLNARVIALAHYAGRALVERVMAGHGSSFLQNVTLRAAAVADGSITPDALAAEVTDALKIDKSDADAVIEELITANLMEADPIDPSWIQLTDAGRDLYARSSADTGAIAARLYDGIPAEDLKIAGRVLTLIAQRANAELAAAA
ncbi:conserved hypothetical protein [Catenulispora acidiphila DSM 44928]|uniref:Transcriptional regulator, MarR family n=1 Tax=Catenulispora acidiphila (strain DSM 44928 / JCM 14897 / NBRC 102108 / NRRL B-24433 / ID139908) TaxID=479433 RepID=C7QEK2_CATAD|nr:hypothetical protein [Catenulispora acidiphila]ACU70893.1 conserved hypothetical protein [Catenulispora acidiphila DSM 44928]